LISSQKLGKQDPFLQFSLNFEEKDSFLKTFTHKNAGENATWNQTFTISLNGEENLYVEVLNEETTVNEVIGFCAIPIKQIVESQGANMNGLFEIYNTKGERAGEINLQLAASGFPNSETPNFNCAPIRGQSYVHESHSVRMTSTKKKSTGMAIGGAILGAGLAVGAGFLGKKMYDNHEEQEAEEERQKVEAEAEEQRKRLEQQKFEHDRDELSSERERYDREKSEFEQKKHESEGLEKRSHDKKQNCKPSCKKNDCEGECKKNCKPNCKKSDCEGECKKKCKSSCKKDDCEGECKKKKKNKCKSSCKKNDCEGECRKKKKNRGGSDSGSGSSSDSGSDSGSNSDSGDDDECRRRRKNSCDGGDAKNWNPVGTYAAGDRVKYHGQVYMCLQGHTSNPTWQPGAAHSLWQAE
jgi:hypothetical protein